MTTLAGVDSNNNDVRDDIERYIALTYPSPADEGLRAALTQYSKASQKSILNANNPSSSEQYAANLIEAAECLLSKKPTEALTILHELEARILNSMERIQSFSTAQKHASGSTFLVRLPSDLASACKE